MTHFFDSKSISRTCALLLMSLCVLVLMGCETSPPKSHAKFEAVKPRSVLVLPPVNNTVEIDATYVYLSTISQPIGEMGYYVFPVEVVDAFMKDNGISEPFEMHQIPLDKLTEVFGADTVLKIQIDDFGQKYVLLSSNTVVGANAELIDLKTGQIIWKGRAQASEGSGDAGAGLTGMMVAAVVDQVIDSLQSRVRDVARSANNFMIQSRSTGFSPGPYYPVEPKAKN